ncbi:glycosyltransferase family 2 protein [Pedobacter paludis]|uniref:Glycosyl transferase n=1 Tax=Pedobacter paludis TaxID=2203212 RepID=A0A317F3P4_9SPHI|nr:glycosyltransferase family 2 protein [Pedobacter paludis]PWS33764.1 glycosyl transferase [Pedobacter paludis]
MFILHNPKWISQYDFAFNCIEEIPNKIFDSINLKLDVLQSPEPEVSILISAWNEELNILKTIASLADLKTDIGIEIIVVNNNSTDSTQETLNKLKVKNYFQPIQGWGPARQMGLENSKGKYILLADADCIYPECWVDEMLKVLKKPNVVCVYGRYSFIAEKGYPRWKLFILETLKDIIAEIRHFKRPYLNAFGISLGYIREYGIKIGYVMHKIRGEDGRMCFDLMQYGKIKQVKSNKTRAWTKPRTLQKDGSFSQALFSRIKLELKRFFSMFTSLAPHDTKTSKNE